MAWTYMLECNDGSFYVGSSRDLAGRVEQHGLGKGAAYTRKRLPVKLVWAEEFDNVGDAFEMEKRVQGWGRAKRQALINGEYERLPGLSLSPQRRRRIEREQREN